MSPPIERNQRTSIVSRLRDLARLTPDQPAVACPTGLFTYADLDATSDRVAVALQHTRQEGAPVAGVLAHRSPVTIAQLVGCLKAGWAAMPLDSTRPGPQREAALRRVQATCCLSAEPIADIDGWRIPTLIGTDHSDVDADPPLSEPSPNDACVIMQTTGSTGEPALFRLSHRTVRFHAGNYVQALGLTSEDRMACVIPLFAGAAVSNVFGTLLSGATLCLFDPLNDGFHRLAQGFDSQRITVAYFTASMFRTFVAAVGSGVRFPDLRVVKLGGEPVDSADFARFRDITEPGARLVNGLGITDAGGNVCFNHFDHDEIVREGPLPVGRPVCGLDVRIEDGDGREAETGEIVIRGPYLAEPVGPAAGQAALNVCRSGDVGTRLSDGSIQCLGRTNDILKIRGARVIPALTDHALRGVPGVRDAATVAIADEDGHHRLVSFVEGGTSEKDLMDRVSAQSPGPQVPSRIVLVDRIHRHANGKIDRQSLCRDAMVHPPCSLAPGRPDDPLMRQLHDVWCAILRRDAVGCSTAFTSLGGDSLSAAEMLTRVYRITGVHLPLTALYEAPTIAMLAQRIRESSDGGEWNVVVEMTRARHGMPFVCIPGAGSDIESLRDLAERVGEDRPFVALRMPGTDGSAWPPDGMDGIMDSFLPAVRRYQPHGPYLLGGSSFGGVIAYELARRLSGEGETIGAIVLLDSYAGGHPRANAGLSLRGRMAVARRWLLPVGMTEEWTRSNVLDGLRQRRNRLAVKARRRLRGDPCSLSAEMKYVCLLDAALRAHSAYDPGTSEMRLDLFACRNPFPDTLFGNDPTLGWGRIAGDNVTVHPVPGRHGQHIQSPFVDRLAKELVRGLRNAEQAFN